MIATIIDCNDLEAMTQFWSELLDVPSEIHEPFGFLGHSADRKVTIWLQRVQEPRVGKNRVHLDFGVDDLDAALVRVERLGGTIGAKGQWQDFHWRTCADPEGNVFDIMQKP